MRIRARLVACSVAAAGAVTGLAACTSTTNGHLASTPSSSATTCASTCAHPDAEFRGVIAPAVPVVSTRGERTYSGRLPNSEAAYDRLPAASRTALASFLGSTDCAAPTVRTAQYRVVCATEDGRRLALLTGPAVVRGADIVSAIAEPPDRQVGATEWAVNVTLDASGAANWSRYTGAHNTMGSADVSGVTRCGTPVPCADYVALIVDGVAVSVPFNEAQLDNTIQISGGFTRRSAQALAKQLSP